MKSYWYVICSLLILLPWHTHAQERLPYKITPAQLSTKDRQVLEKLEAYLTSINTIRSDFIQFAPDGSVSTGKFFLERPGKLRMEYAPPTPVLIIAKGDTLIFYDYELQQLSHVSLESSLVGFLARDKVRFDDTVIITAFEHEDSTLRVTLVQSKRPKEGVLTLELEDKPLSLRNMVVTDAGGQRTTVALNSAEFDVPLASDLFVFNDPRGSSKRSIKK